MLFVRGRLINILGSALKCKPRIYLDQSQCRAVVHLPNSFISKAFFSNNAKPTEPIKTPLTNLIGKDASQQKKEQDDEEEAKRTREASWRTMKYTLIIFGVSITCLGAYLVVELGKPTVSEDGTILRDEFTHLPMWKQYIYRFLREVDYYKRLIKEPSREKLLPDVMKYPYYQPPYTLVLELTDVLVHPDWTYKTGWRFKKRPGIEHFLDSLNGVYEIVIYTAEQGMTVFPIIEALDPKNIIAYKLVRDATHFVDGHHVKNLDKLNRDLTKVIVVDWNLDNVKFHPENVFYINRWIGNDDDTTLVDLAAFLRTIAQSEIEDVREVLKYYSSFEDPLATFREKQKLLIEQQEAEREARSATHPPPVKRWTPSFFSKPPF
ncbi:hypothetical protein ILUMI_21805 [Ignelater luminosus]|uniref:Mitochondrial import inner membrane translocase subunit TIM50 n=1 Tax=Ignelater luminosus TaxID=2038154 RepID=A0A8K0G370_IGNLU|nr:hypothetical protein ILUMI_21805 [Ignelater luminosus]